MTNLDKSASSSRRKPSEARIRKRNEAKVLRAAVELFSRKGFDGTRIAEIADASDLPKTNVYYYFPTKEAIYTTLIERLLSDWDKALEHIRPERDPRDALADYIAAKLEYSRRNPIESRFFAGEMMRGGKFISRGQMKRMRAITGHKAAVIEAWINNGKLKPVEPVHFLIMLWATTQFYADFSTVVTATLGQQRLTRTTFAEARDTITETVLAGCLAD